MESKPLSETIERVSHMHMQAHTRMEVVHKLSFDVLSGLNSTMCNCTLKSSNATADASSGMTTRFLIFTVVLMLLLGSLLLWSSMLRLFLGHQTLNLRLGGYNLYPMVRVALRATFVIFLPLLSSVSSHTRGKGGDGGKGEDECLLQRSSNHTELLLMLLWLLLVELIRKKVQAMDLTTDGSSFTRSIGRFTLMDNAVELGHLTWTGYLVYDSISFERLAMKTIFIALWSISLIKLLQRVLNTWLASRSWHTAKNPLLIAGYMQHVTDTEQERHYSSAASAMEECEFVVAKEHKLVPKKDEGILYCIGGPRIDNKHVGVRMNLARKNELVTVGKIWKLKKDHDPLFKGARGTYLENLCFSFSLFKLLRRRFEQYPMVEVGSRSSMGRRMMIEGLLNMVDADDPRSHHRPFQVLQLELDFLEDYYQAVDPVVRSNPILFFLNFGLSMLLVPIYLLAILVTLVHACFCLRSPFLYLSITLALLATVISIECAEFYTSYLLANWNTVRLVCSYYTKLPPRNGQHWLLRIFFYYFVVFRFLVHRVLRYLAKKVFRCGGDNIKINQASIVQSCCSIHLSFKCTCQATLETKTEEDIINSLKLIDMETGHISLQVPPLFNGSNMVDDKHTTRTASITEIILVYHLATELYEIEYKNMERNKLREDGARTPNEVGETSRAVATTLSRYCMYLVEHMPTLLPDDETWVSGRANEMRKCLTHILQQCHNGCMRGMSSHSCNRTIADSLKEAENLEDQSTLGALKLLGEIKSWEELAHFWVNLLIYLAPSNNIQGHAQAVASSGGDLISYLWAFCTHAGITRLPLVVDCSV
jgi:hypothetical protein